MAKLKRTVIVGGLSGSSGPVNFRLTKGGTLVCERSTPANPNTPAQQAARARMTTVSRLFKAFTASQKAAWVNYAHSLTGHDAVTQQGRPHSAISAFIKLGTKYLQVTPTGTVPMAPPANPYSGDSITLTASASAGKVTFTASAANQLSTKTELLLQPLASPNRLPQKNGYRTKAFNAFTAGGLSFDVNVPPGWYAAAYRFVNVATGQDTELQGIGVSQVTLALVQVGGKKKAA